MPGSQHRFSCAGSAYNELKKPLVQAVKTARTTPRTPIKTTFGEMKGVKSDMVTKLVVEIIDYLRYVDILGTLQLMIDIFKEESDERIQRQIIESVKHLAEYNLDVYAKAGPAIQLELLGHLTTLGGAEIDSVRPIALAVWTECLQSDITGTKWKADSVELRTGAVPLSDQLALVRERAISALFEAFDRSQDDGQRREVLSALDAATRTPIQGGYSNELLALTLEDTRKVVEFLTPRAAGMSYELRQHVEHQQLHDYRRASALVEDKDNRFGCQAPAAALRDEIRKFRDSVGSDLGFERYKVLVGFESVYPQHWTDDQFDYQEAEAYRAGKVNEYLEEIGARNADEWFELIKSCAQTKSSDLATFPVFGAFLASLAQRHPEIAERFLLQAPPSLRRFSPAFYNGLVLSDRTDIHLRTLNAELEASTDLSGLARHLRHPAVHLPAFADQVLLRALEREDIPAVIECLVFAFEQYGTGRLIDPEAFVQKAFKFLNARKETRWVGEAWFLERASEFYKQMRPEASVLILESLTYIPKVTFCVFRTNVTADSA